MKEKRFKRAVVVGTGMMGPGIALTLAKGGLEVKLAGRSTQSVDRGLRSFRANVKTLLDNELLGMGEASVIEGRVSGTMTILEEAAKSDLVVESIIEDLKVKREFFGHLGKVCPSSTVFTSNTSGIRITEIAANISHPERVLTTHFWNPPFLIPLVEVILGERSAPEVGQAVFNLLEECGKTPILVRKDLPGQAGNRLFHALIRESAYLVQEGVCTAEDVDKIIQNSFGLRFPVYGPLDHIDLVGLDMVSAIQAYVAPHLCNIPDCLPIFRKKVAHGDLGAKTGKGFYDWSKRSADEVKRRRDAFIIRCLRERRGHP